MDLFRSGHFIIDARNTRILDEGFSLTFNFEKMHMYSGKATSQKKPIYFDGVDLFYWVSGRWTKWNESRQKAINTLFNAHAELQLLGD